MRLGHPSTRSYDPGLRRHCRSRSASQTSTRALPTRGWPERRDGLLEYLGTRSLSSFPEMPGEGSANWGIFRTVEITSLMRCAKGTLQSSDGSKTGMTDWLCNYQ